MKKLPFLLAFCLFANNSTAQSLLYENSFFNIMATNPAFAGARKDFNLNALLGSRFNGTNTPQQISQIISLDGQVGQHSNGLGMQAFNGTLGNLNTQGVLIDYAYRIPVGETISFSLGLRGGFTYLPSFYASTSGGATQFFPYAGVGALVSSDDFFVSLSEPVVLSKDASSGIVNQKPFFASAGYSLEPSEKIMFNPNVQYEINSFSGNALNLNAKVWFSRKFAVGAFFKSKSEGLTPSFSKFIGSIEVKASNSIRLGLSYDDDPYAGLSQNPNSYGTGGILQIFFRYETTSEREGTNRLKFF
jgi:type IX secretion system PorP/SprF family membrane protein